MALWRGSPRPVCRTKHENALVLGKYEAADPNNPGIRVNNQGKQIFVVQGSDNVIEVLTTMAGCPLFWVPYTVGNPLSSGVVVGGYLANGKATYVARV